MGGRGAFVDIDKGNFTFVEGGQQYVSVGEIDGIKVLVKVSGPVKAPEYSHTANRRYAIIQNGRLKHITTYDENHKQVSSIDLGHEHYGLQPHKHINMDHSDRGIPITEEELTLIKRIRRRYNVQ